MNHYCDADIAMEFDIAGFASHAGTVLGEWLDAAGIDGRLDAPGEQQAPGLGSS